MADSQHSVDKELPVRDLLRVASRHRVSDPRGCRTIPWMPNTSGSRVGSSQFARTPWPMHNKCYVILHMYAYMPGLLATREYLNV